MNVSDKVQIMEYENIWMGEYNKEILNYEWKNLLKIKWKINFYIK